ncbi:MAG: hypothetical protein ACKOPM_10540 [Novosphingobium sp.]
MSDAALLPGVRFEVRPPAVAAQPLRTDIAGFMGPTLRGPVGEVVRIDGWRAYVETFGDLTSECDMPYALRGYFENGGEIAYVVRLAAAPLLHAEGLWTVGEVAANKWLASAPIAGRFEAQRFLIRARSPGAWANGLQVKPRYRLRGPDRRPEVDLEIVPANGAGEFLLGLPAAGLVEAVNARSALINLIVQVPPPPPDPAAPAGPLAKVWAPVTLAGGTVAVADEAEYAAGAAALAATREVALMAAPDLETMPGGELARTRILGHLTALADGLLDRQVIGAPPRTAYDAGQIAAWLSDFRSARDGDYARSLAVYHPLLAVPDPLGGIRAPVRLISPVGHVAGVISRLDRERGAHHSPANAELYEAVDIAPRQPTETLAVLAAAGVNPLLCATGNGIVVWGGRTAARVPDPARNALEAPGRFLAHRRLIHRLVRAIRRVAEPVVFDNNGPDLWLTLARAITSLLLEAWNAGALKGEVPEEAFQVVCNADNNPPENEESGLVLCEIALAPAAPMEFITLRIAMTREGWLEAIET